ncbi:beta-1,6-N-acetylglucosaminyltransferase [Larsenimonas suaedae]|uniref:Beta-1,6-N-acetylglucosaminyltransferase n=1 Tax=Larsenimonas suaedae TaxID=1851019 RepID=A0ABU1GYF1_9GAMM|nr:beta-1,6-N-acetylglucosaminyltransferase [Larsenimonas suaedae]MCM2972791.1 beta-1,6-N-acetylglucosaminyltransferase [Larsenimonas suaedae]MDR5896890.1 beta-1,6-N-acetylglucosaminyltransferase [Larsenimonas suaedae]
MHVVMMLAHKDKEQLALLIDYYCQHEVGVVVHIDAKQEQLHQALSQHYAGNERVVVLERPVRVNWSGVSLVEAERRLMRSALTCFPEAEYFHLVSGDCLPVLPPAQWASILQGRTSLESRRLPEFEWRMRCYMPFGESPKNRTFAYRLTSLALRKLQLMLLPKRSNFGAEAELKGSQWFSMTCSDMKAVDAACDDAFMKRLKHTRCSDEHFMQILFAELGLDFDNDDRRYIQWESGKASPEYLNDRQISEAAKSRTYLFARKVQREQMQTFLTS